MSGYTLTKGLCVFHVFSFQAYELSTLTGTQIMLLVASETGHVYTFATSKLQPMITSENGKSLIQACLNAPAAAEGASPLYEGHESARMSSAGYEEPDLMYHVKEETEAMNVAVSKHTSNYPVSFIRADGRIILHNKLIIPWQ